MNLLKRNYDFLILGSNGNLEKEIIKILKKKKFTFFKIAKKKSNYNINLNNHKKLENIFKNLKFKYVINCAALINLEKCEKNKISSSKINYLFPKFLAKISNNYKFKLIHISTDHVYFSKNKILHSENSKTKAVNHYAKTKIQAEKILKKSKKYIIIRTNFVGRSGFQKPSFVDWIYLSIKKKKKIKLFYDMFTSTIDIESCARYILLLSLSNSIGIFNLGSRGQISKEKFALKFTKKLGLTLNYESVSTNIFNINRGKNLGMNVNKIEKKLKIKMPTINKVISNLVKYYK